MDTINDMASLTNFFTTVTVLRAIDDYKLDYQKPVAEYLPEFAANGKGVTILMLLTHTSGFPADPEPGLYDPSYTTMQQRVDVIIKHKMINAPGTKYLYSDLNFMNLRFVLERVASTPFGELVYSFTRKLGMTSRFFNKGNLNSSSNPFYPGMAPTEYQMEVLGDAEPQRPQPVGETVHDENA